MAFVSWPMLLSCHQPTHSAATDTKFPLENVGQCVGISSLWKYIHKVRIYKEYHSVCPLVGIGTLPTPLSPASVPLPQEQGGGSPKSDDLRKSLALCLLCGSIVFRSAPEHGRPFCESFQEKWNGVLSSLLTLTAGIQFQFLSGNFL
jgi:hypothetical protein